MKAELSEKLILLVKVVIFVSLSSLIVGLICFNAADRSDPVVTEPPVFIENWTVTDPNGVVFKAGKTYRNSDGTLGTFVMDSKLPDNIRDASFLSFITGGTVEIYINGELRKDFVEERDVIIPGGISKRFMILVPSATGPV